MNIKGLGCRLSVIGLAVSIAPAFAAVQREEFTRGGQTKTIKLTSSQAQQVMNVLEEKNYSLGDALDKAQNECNGTPVAAESSVVSANEYKHTFTQDNMERQSGRSQSESKVLIQVACASAGRGGQLEMVAVCPETDETTLMAGAFGQASGRQVRFQNDEWSRNDERAPYGQSNRSRYNDDPQTDDWRQDYHGDTDDTWTETDRNEDNWREEQYRDRARDNRFGRNDRWFDRNTRSRERMDIFKGSQVIGANVENHNGEDLGSIEDIAIDPRTGRVKYVVLQSGGFMGIGGKYFAVPWQTLQPRGQDEFLVSIDEQTFERLPGFDDDNWPQSADTRLFRQQQRGFDEQQAGRFDDPDAERRGFLTGRQFRQTGQLNIQPAQARAFAQVLDQNGFTLKQAIEKGEEHCNGKAVAAKCAYSRQAMGFQTRGQFQDTDRQVDWDTQTEYSRQDQNQRQGATTGQASRANDVVVEVTCLKEGETNKATIVVISPENGEVINTREETLTQARRTSGPGNM